ncbi:dihydropteroate synthase [Corynebacterium epidermidicanis]|uniref:Dihydropteroate synthase n=1 Tax=Corynebacterium epidermidicanis TaxID=1050174 RepID=A0A0G3GS78_9CORY|nr:dihydropteroate synthase [Corynebacterium epidermidicanis]AKK03989.1 Dihydropteroate synthase [Corynebacterium epidermidicanis]
MRVSDLTNPDRCLVMGIVNVTDDSFSDGGRYTDVDKAVAHALALVDAGADLIDVGGESTRPGATRVSAQQELERVVPVIAALREAGVSTSVDTMRASVAAASADAGVSLINDVSGGLADPEMFAVMAEKDLPVCLMHWRTDRFGDAAGSAHRGADVVADVHETFAELTEKAIRAGISPENIVLDPGLGFAKTAVDNWALLRALPEFVAGEYPILVGASRKRFLTAIRGDRGLEASPLDADAATAAVSTLSAQAGAWCVRVHDVVSSRDAVDVVAAWQGARHG